jgi:hypothetical protein
MKRYLKCTRTGEIRILLCADNSKIEFGSVLIYTRNGYDLMNIDDPLWERWIVIDESILKENKS